MTWVLTVDSSTTSAVAISAFDRPRAINSSTSRSRGVSSCSRGSFDASGAGCCAIRSMTRLVTEGESSESPAWTVRIAEISPSGDVRFSRNPDAPALSAPKM